MISLGLMSEDEIAALQDEYDEAVAAAEAEVRAAAELPGSAAYEDIFA